MEGTAYLIGETFQYDEIGQAIPTEETKEILCHIESVSQNEFFKAGQNGINSDLKIVTPAVNYNNESIINYDGNRYGIYRSYRNPNSDEVELYCEWKGGISGQESQD